MLPWESIDPYWEVRLAAAERISQDRKAAGLAPVELDVLASQVADRHCQEMAGHDYLSHWNLRGLLPHQRYHLAGGRDHAQENSSRLTIISANPFPISTEPADVLSQLLRAHESFMAEKPPLDFHRRNILDAGHTHVGIGFGVVEGNFTMSQLFVNRYARLREFPETLPRGSIQVDGEMLRRDYGPYYCMLFYEGPPQSRSPEELNLTYAYSDTEGEECGKVAPWEMQFNRGRFRFSMPIRNRGAGYYHLLLWVRDRVASIPYHPTPGASHSVNTQEAIPGAGWTFRA
ncbi:MAG: CAP domain-containing protein [Acidobacteria bacterium]|nr:CAP domain-containing protein [Acidobacteriota bacterium]